MGGKSVEDVGDADPNASKSNSRGWLSSSCTCLESLGAETIIVSIDCPILSAMALERSLISLSPIDPFVGNKGEEHNAISIPFMGFSSERNFSSKALKFGIKQPTRGFSQPIISCAQTQYDSLEKVLYSIPSSPFSLGSIRSP